MALSNIYIYNYNNYFNRRVKKEASLAGYGTPIYSLTNTNFNPSDGVITAHVLGTNDYNGKGDYLIETDSANNILSRWFIVEADRTKTGQYQVVLKRDVIVDNYSIVTNAPCFIKKAMVDYNNPLILNSEGMTYNQIKKEEILLKDKSNTPWIVGYLNKKGIIDTYTFSISASTGTTTLTGVTSVIKAIQHAKDQYGNSYDNTIPVKGPNDTYGWTFDSLTHEFTWNTPWTLMDRTNTIEVQYKGDFSTTAEFEYLTEPSGYIEAENLPWEFNPYDTMLGGFNPNASEQLTIDGIDSIYRGKVTRADLVLNKNSNGKFMPYYSSATEDSYNPDLNDSMFPLYQSSRSVAFDSAFWLQSYVKKVVDYNYWSFTQADMNTLIDTIGLKAVNGDPTSYNNAIIKYQGNFYRLTVGNAQTTTQSFTIKSGALYDKHQEYLQQLVSYWNNHQLAEDTMYYHIATGNVPGTSIPVVGNAFWGNVAVRKFPLTITRISNTVTRAMALEFPGTIIETQDAPYNMFCMPLNSVHLVNANVDTNPEATLQMSWQLPLSLGSNLYDLQLLPYCPIQSVINAAGNIVEVGTEGIEFSYLWDKDPNGYKIYNVCFFCRNTKGTFDIDTNLSVGNFTSDAAKNVKIESETVTYRLVSPNYNGQFEFKVSHNMNPITKINVDYEYKPYNPYIHVSPVWSANGLYGNDYDDARGLICGGDFSLPIVNDAWTEYQITNKNYQAIFDRQIQSMQVNFNLQQKMKDDQALIGIFTSTAAGTGAGAAIGGGWGALAGAALGLTAGVAGAFGRTLDAKYETQQYTEQVSAMKDTFKYQLQNIQALPYSLSKVSAYNNNNKLFPFLEKYTATDKEVEALIKKITYTSMEIGVVDTIDNYIVPSNLNFLSGELLILDGLDDDTHVANEIYNEIKKGVYI